MKTTLLLLLLLLILTACAAPATPSAQAPALPSTASRPADILSPPSTTPAIEVTALPTQAATPTLRPTHNPDDWQNLPVIPAVSERAREIYQRGLERGINPRWRCS